VASTAANWLRYVGVACEVVGFILIALDIRQRRQMTDQQSMGEWLAAVARRVADTLPFRRSRDATVSVSAVGVTTSVGKALAGTWNVAPKTATLDERIAVLEDRMGRIEERAAGLESDVRQETEDRQNADDAERQAREETDETVRQLLLQLTAGNLWYERIGVFLFLVGLVLANLSQEIVDAFS
jgi:hypothetical protein